MSTIVGIATSAVISRRGPLIALAAGAALAAVAPRAAPSSLLLPGPDAAGEHALASLALLLAFAAGYVRPRAGLYALVTLAVVEGAIRKWIVNDVSVFMIKDFLTIGVYAAVLPQLSAAEWRRPRFVLVPVVALLALAVAYSLKSDSLSQAAIGLRAYAIYVPLIWVAPRLLNTPRRVNALLVLVVALGIGNSVLAALQALTGDEWLNRVVPGVIPSFIVVDGAVWQRPTGTLLQVGTFGAFLLFPVLVSFGLLVGHRRGWGFAGALGALFFLSWGVIYAGSRALFATIMLAALFVFAYLLLRRRFVAILAIPAVVVAAYFVASSQTLVGGPVGSNGDSQFLRNQTYLYAAPDGTIQKFVVSIERADPSDTKALVRRAGFQAQGTDPVKELPSSRAKHQLSLLAKSGLIGEGTGKQALGSQYLLPERTEHSESAYVRVAYELGIPGLVAFVGMLVALWLGAAWASFVSPEWRRPLAAVSLATMTLVPALSALTFAFDYPVVALLYYTLGGCALAWAIEGRRVRQPIPTERAAPPAAVSAAPSRAPA